MADLDEILYDLIERASNITKVNLHDHDYLQSEAKSALKQLIAEREREARISELEQFVEDEDIEGRDEIPFDEYGDLYIKNRIKSLKEKE